MMLLRGGTLAFAALQPSRFSPPTVMVDSRIPLDLPVEAKPEPITSVNGFQARWLPISAVKDTETELVSFKNGILNRQKKQRKKPMLTWEEKFALLRAFKKAHGHCSVPPGYTVAGFKLGGWVATQRKEYIKHRLGLFSSVVNDRRVMRLERVGFEWDTEPFHALSFVLPTTKTILQGF